MTRNELKNIMTTAWSFVKKNGYTMSEALKVAWANVKLHKKMLGGIVKFFFEKVDGTIRQAFGTLNGQYTPAVGDGRKPNDSIQVYWDTEKEAWRCFKKANLIKVA